MAQGPASAQDVKARSERVDTIHETARHLCSQAEAAHQNHQDAALAIMEALRRFHVDYLSEERSVKGMRELYASLATECFGHRLPAPPYAEELGLVPSGT